MSGSNGRRRNDAILSPDIAVTTGGELRTCVGVLALQGDFREHRIALGCLGAATREVRHPHDLRDVDGLVVPGGESTTIGRLMVEYGLVDAVREFARGGRPVFGTCAGLITLARDTVEGYRQPLLRLIDIVARRNAFGRQVRSFEVDLAVPIMGAAPLRAVFIRAPWIEHAGPGVAVLAECQGHGVAAQEGNVLVTAFHPELTGDLRVHEHFLTMVERARAAEAPDGVADAATRMSEEVVS